jgi:hypothetical protein
VLYDRLLESISCLGEVEIRVTRSQVAFRRQKNFGWVWIPTQYLHRKAAPLVLTLAMRRRDSSPRWKQIVEPYPGRFTHHLELYSVRDVDEEVETWLKEAWQQAG